ncbi:N-acetylglucosamine-6-phosphate deacetylase [Acidobacteria bacterium AH-259-L09]|nr:N-acetylglucosamine-6-phosphate deacetylase [Acidobacteria bacterium AH-259-L09]
MSTVNSLVIYAKQILTPEDDWEDGLVHIQNGKISYVGKQSLDLPPETKVYTGHCLIPGMVDLHINGTAGGDAAEGTHQALEKMSRSLAAHGATAFLPTIITDHEEELVRSLQALSEVLDDQLPGARPLGIHLEGPFINPAQKGAHRADCIQAPSLEIFQKYFKAANGKLRMLTLAPEMKGALELIHEARKELSIVSLGHSNADYGCAVEAIEAGANLATHIFNAMPELHHREPGLVGAVLDSEDISAEIIADGIHVHPVMVRFLARCKGPDKLVLVTDAISAADMPDGRHRVGNVEVTVKEGVCRNQEGVLAGSSLTMDRGLKNLYDWLNEDDLKRIVAMATIQPAALLGLENKGRIEKDCDADLVLLDEDLQVRKTWIAGELV